MMSPRLDDRKGTARGPRRCPKCGEELKKVAKYCPRCGRPSKTHLLQKIRAFKIENEKTRRDVRAMGLTYGGVVVVLAVLGLAGCGEWHWAARLGLSNALFVAVGTLGTLLLGKGANRECFARGAAGPEIALGALSGLATLAVGLAYFWLIFSALGLEWPDSESLPLAALIIEMALFPALVEEWLCRGVLWTATRRVSSRRMAIVVTAMLFAFLHIPGSGYLGVPHRFFAGLVFGWWRARSTSLLPGMAGHFVNNLCALLIF